MAETLIPAEPVLMRAPKKRATAGPVVTRRAALASVGCAAAVLPFFVFRVLMALTVMGATERDVSALSFVPFEFLVPFLASFFVLRRHPAMKTLGFTLRVFLTSLVAAPLIVAALFGGEYVRHFGAPGDWGQALMVMLGLVPSAGAIGLTLFVLLAAPWILATYGATAGLDLLFCRRHTDELQDLERARLLRERMDAGFYDVPGLPRGEREAMSREFEKLEDEIERLIGSFPATTDEGRLVRHLRDQLHEALGAYARVARLLTEKLSPTELTYQRYLSSARHVYQSLVEHLRTAAQVAGAASERPSYERTAEVRQLAAANEDGLKVLHETAQAIARMNLQQGRESLDLGVAVRELEELAKRADRYT